MMGPGCPVCVTDAHEVDEGVALALQGVHIATYGDMLRVPGSVMSLADAQSEGAKIHVIKKKGGGGGGGGGGGKKKKKKKREGCWWWWCTSACASSSIRASATSGRDPRGPPARRNARLRRAQVPARRVRRRRHAGRPDRRAVHVMGRSTSRRQHGPDRPPRCRSSGSRPAVARTSRDAGRPPSSSCSSSRRWPSKGPQSALVLMGAMLLLSVMVAPRGARDLVRWCPACARRRATAADAPRRWPRRAPRTASLSMAALLGPPA